MIFVVSANVSLNHWTICFSIALILSSSGAKIAAKYETEKLISRKDFFKKNW